MKFYSNNHSFSACQLRFCGAVQTRHGNVYIRARRTLFQRSLRRSRYMDTILLLRFDETYEPTFRRLHRAKPFSYVHLTVNRTNKIEGGGRGNIFYSYLLREIFRKNSMKISYRQSFVLKNAIRNCLLSRKFIGFFFIKKILTFLKHYREAYEIKIYNLASSILIIFMFRGIAPCLECV